MNRKTSHGLHQLSALLPLHLLQHKNFLITWQCKGVVLKQPVHNIECCQGTLLKQNMAFRVRKAPLKH